MPNLKLYAIRFMQKNDINKGNITITQQNTGQGQGQNEPVGSNLSFF